MSYLIAVEGSDKLQKSMCKLGTVISIFNFLLSLANKQPVECGGPVVTPIMAVILGANSDFGNW